MSIASDPGSFLCVRCEDPSSVRSGLPADCDESNRDGQLQSRITETSEFPTATFTLTEPIDLGAVPADGEEISAEATGDLTMHGETRSITFELTAQLTGDTFAVNATIPSPTDYGIDDHRRGAHRHVLPEVHGRGAGTGRGGDPRGGRRGS